MQHRKDKQDFPTKSGKITEKEMDYIMIYKYLAWAHAKNHQKLTGEILDPEVDSRSIVERFDDMLEFIPAVPMEEIETMGFEIVKKDPTGVKILPVSAQSLPELQKKIRRIAELGSLDDIGAVLESDKEIGNKFRTAILYRSLSGIRKTLESEKLTYSEISLENKPNKLCFLVTCQGSHIPGMGRGIYATSPTFRNHFDYCADLIEKVYGFDIRGYLEDKVEDKPKWMECPRNFLPYLLSIQYALFKQFEEWGIKPQYVLGLSFGEYGAATMAGIITIEEALTLIMTRIELMMAYIPEEAFCVSMMDTDAYYDVAKEAKAGEGMEDFWLDLAAINSPKQTCVVGHMKYIKRFVEVCKTRGIKTLLNSPYHPYHSRLTLPILDKFLETTSKVAYKSSTETKSPKFISTVNGKICDSLYPEYFLEHLKLPADLTSAINTAIANEGISHFLEIGPHPLLNQMVKDFLYNNNNCPKLEGYLMLSSLIRKQDDNLSLANTLGKLYTAGYDANFGKL